MDVKAEVAKLIKDKQDEIKKLQQNANSTCEHILKNAKIITDVTIPNDIRQFITDVKIPDSVKSIGDATFSYCEALTSIEIPDSVESIGNAAFSYCTSLASIKIPNSVESIGDYAFFDCNSLKEVLFKGKTMAEVKEMDYYPWGIQNESIIKAAG